MIPTSEPIIREEESVLRPLYYQLISNAECFAKLFELSIVFTRPIRGHLKELINSSLIAILAENFKLRDNCQRQGRIGYNTMFCCARILSTESGRAAGCFMSVNITYLNSTSNSGIKSDMGVY